MLVVGGSRIDIAIRCNASGTHPIINTPHHPHFPTISANLSLDNNILTLFSLVVTATDSNDTTDLSTAVFPSYPPYLESTLDLNTSNSQSCLLYKTTTTTTPCAWGVGPDGNGSLGVGFCFVMHV